MSTSNQARVQFSDPNTRSKEMHSTTEQWAQDLIDKDENDRASEQFHQWIDIQQRFPNYSYQNTLLINFQRPEATKIADYRTWQEQFGRQIQEGEDAIWIWEPVNLLRSPNNSHSPNDDVDPNLKCDATELERLTEGPERFKPVPFYDVSQTEGKPLPELDTAATHKAAYLLPQLRDMASTVGATVSIIHSSNWTHGGALGVCQPSGDETTIEVLRQDSVESMVGTLIHEYAHLLLHVGAGVKINRLRCELEAEAVAYIVGHHFGLDMKRDVFRLPPWDPDDADVILHLLNRVSHTAKMLIEAIDSGLSSRQDQTVF